MRTNPILIPFLCLAAIAPGLAAQDWPCWRGPRTDGTAGEIPPTSALVDRPEDARLVWTSEAFVPPSGNNHMGKFVTGFASPCVSEGRVFIFWYEGDGKHVNQEKLDGKWKGFYGKTPQEWRVKVSSITASEIVLCVDAATGKTLWKTVVGTGPNLQGSGSGKIGGHFSMVAGDGKAFAVGINARLYALDTETGEVLWSAPTGGTEQRDAWLQKCIEDGWLEKRRRPHDGWIRHDRGNICSCAAYTDGVVLFRNLAFDAETGKVLWKCKYYGGYASPVVWTHEGKRYFINGAGQCIEPKSGRVLWEAIDSLSDQNFIKRSGCIHLGSGYMVWGNGFACFRITPAKAELVWEYLPTEGEKKMRNKRGGDMGSSPVINGDYFYANTRYGGTRRICHMICVELATGKEIARVKGPSNSGSLVAYGPWVLEQASGAGGFDGVGKLGGGYAALRAATPEKTTGVLDFIGVIKPPRHQHSVTPAIVGSRIYFRGGERLHCLELAKGSR